MELRHLRYFVAVAETENVSRAALKLHVSQPALSRQIRDLEDEIGFCLLERTAKSVRLTDAGRAFLDDVRALLQHADEAVKKARAVASAEPSELHVGHSTPFAEILPKILRAFQRAMPNVHVRLHNRSYEAIFDGVRDGRLQLALIARPPKASSLRDVRYEELFHERVCLAVAPNHPFARRRSVPLTDAVCEPFIALTAEGYPVYYDYLLAILASQSASTQTPSPARAASRRLVTPSEINTGAMRNVCSARLGAESVTRSDPPNWGPAKASQGHALRSAGSFTAGCFLIKSGAASREGTLE